LRRETFIPVLLSQPPMQRAKEEDKTERVGGNGKFTCQKYKDTLKIADNFRSCVSE